MTDPTTRQTENRPKVPLSVLELSPVAEGRGAGEALRSTLDLARFVDALGYRRFWLAEHHNMPSIASAAPEILIGHVAQVTRNLRVGSGGVMLPNHAPLRVAEAFKTLEALHPGRIDLGIGRAPGTDGLTALALRRSRDALHADDFDAQLAELLAFGEGRFPAEHPFARIQATPQGVPLPPLYLLGSSDYSARLAGQLGVGFAFAYHFSPHALMLALDTYRTHFTPSASLARPHAIVTASVVCAETDAEAERLASSMQLAFAKLRSGEPIALPSPEAALAYTPTPAEAALLHAVREMQTVGSPETVKESLDALLARTGADELMVTTSTFDHEARLRSFSLLAEAYGLQRPPGALPVYASAD